MANINARLVETDHGKAPDFFSARLEEQREKMGCPSFIAVFVVEDDAVRVYLGDSAANATEFVAKHDANSTGDWTALGYILPDSETFGLTPGKWTPAELLVAADTKYRPTVVAKP